MRLHNWIYIDSHKIVHYYEQGKEIKELSGYRIPKLKRA